MEEILTHADHVGLLGRSVLVVLCLFSFKHDSPRASRRRDMCRRCRRSPTHRIRTTPCLPHSFALPPQLVFDWGSPLLAAKEISSICCREACCNLHYVYPPELRGGWGEPNFHRLLLAVVQSCSRNKLWQFGLPWFEIRGRLRMPPGPVAASGPSFWDACPGKA